VAVVDGFWALWNGLLGVLEALLRLFHDIFAGVPLLDAWAWGWAIVGLTVLVRIVLLPLAIKQSNSMRAMQALEPELKRIQQKYKADRSLMKTDPEKYRAKRQKQQQEMMKIYRENNANPAMGCLPLLPQIPIFIGMIRLVGNPRTGTKMPDAFGNASFFLVDDLRARAIDAVQGDLAFTSGLGIAFLVVLTGLTLFLTQRQMMRSNPSAGGNPQMKMMMYIMPVGFAGIGMAFPAGGVLYLLTTNLWTMGQQRIMWRNMSGENKTSTSEGS
jgi:YidC/Oxa1 family membrane protein insertase